MLERCYGTEPDRLEREIRRVVLHEIAHHFGIGDERLRELGRYRARARITICGAPPPLTDQAFGPCRDL